MLSCLIPTKVTASIEQFKQLVIDAEAVRASQLLIDLCVEFPLLAGIVTLLKQGSIDEALNNVGMFNYDLANELRTHMQVLAEISIELNHRS